MTDFDIYQPQMWIRDGLVAVSRIGRVKKKSGSSSNRELHWRWITATAVGSLLNGSVAFSSAPVHSQFGETVVIDSVCLDQCIPAPATSEVPTGYWNMLRSSLQSAKRLPENLDFDDPAIVI